MTCNFGLCWLDFARESGVRVVFDATLLPISTVRFGSLARIMVDDKVGPVYAQVRSIWERSMYAVAKGLTAEILLQCSGILQRARTCHGQLRKAK